jgi:hypothetical protein
MLSFAFFIVMLSVAMLNVIMLNVDMLCVIRLNAVMQSVNCQIQIRILVGKSKEECITH